MDSIRFHSFQTTAHLFWGLVDSNIPGEFVFYFEQEKLENKILKFQDCPHMNMLIILDNVACVLLKH
jgi:hypothetical protein